MYVGNTFFHSVLSGNGSFAPSGPFAVVLDWRLLEFFDVELETWLFTPSNLKLLLSPSSMSLLSLLFESILWPLSCGVNSLSPDIPDLYQKQLLLDVYNLWHREWVGWQWITNIYKNLFWTCASPLPPDQSVIHSLIFFVREPRKNLTQRIRDWKRGTLQQRFLCWQGTLYQSPTCSNKVIVQSSIIRNKSVRSGASL